MTESVEDKGCVVYFCDGSSQPNPGFGGYGIFGYVMMPAKRPRNINYPARTGFAFSTAGIVKKSDAPKESYDITEVIEEIGSFDFDTVTNNIAEIKAVIRSIELVSDREEINRIIIFTDSKYVVQGSLSYRHGWKKNGWKTKNGTPVKNLDLWQRLSDLLDKAETDGLKIELNWVKGHADSIGNNIADMYAVIGTNHSRNQFKDGWNPDIEGNLFDYSCISEFTPMSEFKKELNDRPFIYDFRNAIFGTAVNNDTDILLLASPPTDRKNPKKEQEIGVRNLDSVFAMVQGRIPNSMNILKRSARRLPRPYDVTMRINLDVVKADKILTRVINRVGYDPIVTKDLVDGEYIYRTFDGTLLLEEMNEEFPFKVEIGQTFGSLEYGLSNLDMLLESGDAFEITDLIYDKEEKKFVVNHLTKSIDVTDRFSVKNFVLVSKGDMWFGKDIPRLTTLRAIEGTIEGIYVYADTRQLGNLATFNFIVRYTNDKGELNHFTQTNMIGKYLIRRIVK